MVRLIDFSRPVAVLFVAILHCLTDDEDPWSVARAFAERMAPGSLLIVTHLTDDAHPEVGVAAREVYDDANAPSSTAATRRSPGSSTASSCSTRA